MQIYKIQVENFRLLKNFSIDIEEELSLVIGKNNTGKTSILSALDKFLNRSDNNKFHFDDFNIDFKEELSELIIGDILDPNNYIEKGIKLKIFIEYTETCNLENLSKVMMDLDPENNRIVLGFEYILPYNNYIDLKNDWENFRIKEEHKHEENDQYKAKGLYDFLADNFSNYFHFQRKSIEINKDTQITNENNYIDLDKELISTKDIINFKYISARRDVANKDIDKTLSTQTSKIYEKTETKQRQNEAVEVFKDKLSETDDQLSRIYVDLFHDIIAKVGDFGGIKPNESEIEIISNLQHRELLKGNTTVVYKHDDHNKLPEHYNGLGYMNLIYMIFEIEILIQEFKREKERKPADINLLFIEEPEAHTHPQMQYVFIKNIKKLLREGIKREDGECRKLQYIITTHSSHIVADSDFDDVKYLKKNGCNSVDAKNLKDLKKDYDERSKEYHFLTQYLTISRAEIFFAEKVVLIEGDTERILIPTMMKKIDIEEAEKYKHIGEKDPYLPLLSQNISIIEVGAYSHIFDKFIDFLGIKSLIITDLDAINADGEKCRVSDGISYSNSAISHYFGGKTISELKNCILTDKIFSKVDNTWTAQENGKLCITYQTTESGYNARSFEDAFIHINREFIKSNKDKFKGLKNKELFETDNDAYDLAAKCIKKKTYFAMDIIFHTNETFNNWEIPSYIKEGLLWLKKD
ncbi:AAA family ATPase [Coprobacter fastidiosus]|uniref:AAA family ATPase n=1 Tax=Coprobacter fastidiosus TaxID=1099853 RepID=UPI003AB1D3DE